MRNSAPLFAVALAALTISSATAFAASITSCRTEAAQAADEWTKGNLTRADASSTEVVEPVLIIAAGRKYVASKNAIDADTLRPRMLGDLATQRQQVYAEELDRCLGNLTMKIVSKKPLRLKQLDQMLSDHK